MTVEIKKYLPSDGILLMNDREVTEGCNYNQAAGPAQSFFIDGELVAAGGIRLTVGECWSMISKKTKERMADPAFAAEKRGLLKAFKEQIELSQRENELYRLFGDADIGNRFARALKFKKAEHIFVR